MKGHVLLLECEGCVNYKRRFSEKNGAYNGTYERYPSCHFQTLC